jgi:hypothetical protein
MDRPEKLTMRVRLRLITVLLLVGAAGCSSDGSTGIAGLNPPAALSSSVAVEPLLAGTISLPIASPQDGRVRLSVSIRNGLSETVTSGTCAEQIDARPVNGESWFDVTGGTQLCNLRAVQIAPGQSAVFSISADQAKLRLAAGGAGQLVIVRVRTVVSGETRSFAMTSSNERVTAP